VMLTRAHWQGLRRMMGNPGWTEAFPEDWLEFHCTPERVASFREQFRPWIARQPRGDVSLAAQALGVPLVPVNTAADLLDNEQYRHRGYFQSLGGMTYPTAAYCMTATPVRLTRAAPALDADRAEVLT
jgi:crotonobetainyl-CoA:carnitine CoA-transferase CaiB-like acyl-CoA transferase